ncbi:MAG: hypothetical protein AVDCRST_MAG07-1475, partial [uncultured Frankineae bacterium]
AHDPPRARGRLVGRRRGPDRRRSSRCRAARRAGAAGGRAGSDA